MSVETKETEQGTEAKPTQVDDLQAEFDKTEAEIKAREDGKETPDGDKKPDEKTEPKAEEPPADDKPPEKAKKQTANERIQELVTKGKTDIEAKDTTITGKQAEIDGLNTKLKEYDDAKAKAAEEGTEVDEKFELPEELQPYEDDLTKFIETKTKGLQDEIDRLKEDRLKGESDRSLEDGKKAHVEQFEKYPHMQELKDGKPVLSEFGAPMLNADYRARLEKLVKTHGVDASIFGAEQTEDLFTLLRKGDAEVAKAKADTETERKALKESVDSVVEDPAGSGGGSEEAVSTGDDFWDVANEVAQELGVKLDP